jgi:hypothetical protein
MLTEAFRARRDIRESAHCGQAAREAGRQPEPVSAGVDGAAVWVLAGLSGVLSSLDATSGAEVAARLAAPWLWERGLSLYRRRLTGPTIHWRFTAERVLVCRLPRSWDRSEGFSATSMGSGANSVVGVTVGDG